MQNGPICVSKLFTGDKKVESERRCIRIGNGALPSEPNGNQNHTMEGISIFQAKSVSNAEYSNANFQYNLKHSDTNFGSEDDKGKDTAL